MNKLLDDVKDSISTFEKRLEDDWQYAEDHEKEYRDKLEMLYLFKEMIEEQMKLNIETQMGKMANSELFDKMTIREFVNLFK